MSGLLLRLERGACCCWRPGCRGRCLGARMLGRRCLRLERRGALLCLMSGLLLGLASGGVLLVVSGAIGCSRGACVQRCDVGAREWRCAGVHVWRAWARFRGSGVVALRCWRLGCRGALLAARVLGRRCWCLARRARSRVLECGGASLLLSAASGCALGVLLLVLDSSGGCNGSW